MFQEEELVSNVRDCIADLLDRAFPGNPGEDDEDLQIGIEDTTKKIIDVVTKGEDAPVR